MSEKTETIKMDKVALTEEELEAKKAARKAKQKEYREKNAEKLKKQQAEWRVKNAEKIKEKRKENIDSIRAYSRKYDKDRRDDPVYCEKIRARQAIYRQNKKLHPELYKQTPKVAKARGRPIIRGIPTPESQIEEV